MIYSGCGSNVYHTTWIRYALGRFGVAKKISAPATVHQRCFHAACICIVFWLSECLKGFTTDSERIFLFNPSVLAQTSSISYVRLIFIFTMPSVLNMMNWRFPPAFIIFVLLVRWNLQMKHDIEPRNPNTQPVCSLFHLQ